MNPIQTRPRPAIARRSLLLGSVAFISMPLLGCGGGGGGGDGGGGGGGGGGSPTGSLVYRNSGMAAVYNFSNRTELQFDPRTAPFVNPGMAVSRTKVITSAIEGDDSTYFDIGMFGLDGKPSTPLRVRRELSTQTSAAVFNADGTRVAFSVNEPVSASGGGRIDRVLVLAMPAGTVLASIDGYEEPIWLGTSGELLVRDPSDQAMYLVGANLQSATRLADLATSTGYGAYDATPDGRYVVYQDSNSQSTIRVYDRNGGARWVAATDSNSDLRSPAVSPDGRYLAVVARDLLTARPHIVSFGANVTVAVDSSKHALSGSLGECRGRMGWSA
jgi:WD40-like Beta Propeller Repeat